MKTKQIKIQILNIYDEYIIGFSECKARKSNFNIGWMKIEKEKNREYKIGEFIIIEVIDKRG